MSYKEQLHILKLLESGPAKTLDMQTKIDLYAENALHEKTIQRRLKELKDADLIRSAGKNRYSLNDGDKEAYLQNLGGFMKTLFVSNPEFSRFLYGVPNEKFFAETFASVVKPVDTIIKLVKAAQNSSRLTFNYAPQTEEVRNRLPFVRQFMKIGVPQGMIPVDFNLHFLVFIGRYSNLLGETWMPHKKYPVLRQYEFKGVHSLQLHEPRQNVLNLKPAELYRYSVEIWISKQKHEVILEEINLNTGKADLQRRTRTVTGETEILSMVAASLGKVKIINPPQEIIAKSREVGYPDDVLFRFED